MACVVAYRREVSHTFKFLLFSFGFTIPLCLGCSRSGKHVYFFYSISSSLFIPSWLGKAPEDLYSIFFFCSKAILTYSHFYQNKFYFHYSWSKNLLIIYTPALPGDPFVRLATGTLLNGLVTTSSKLAHSLSIQSFQQIF